MATKAVTEGLLRSLVEDLRPAVAAQTDAVKMVSRLARPSPLLLALAGRLPVPETESEIAKLKGALSFLSPDVPRGQGSLYEPGEARPSCDYWVLVIWAIASLGWDCGRDIAREWSRPSARYTDDGFEEAWRSFDPSRSGAIGIGSLYKLAQSHGWQPSAASTPPTAANDSRYRLLTVDDIIALPLVVWLIKGLLPRYGLVVIYGPSGSGKSFLALDLAACIVTGGKWFGMQVKQAPVVYLMLEGEVAIRNRVAALEASYGPLTDADFSAVVQQFTLTTAQDVTDLAAVLPRGAVVFIDTMNRAAPTSDENSSKEMGSIIQGAKELQASIGGLIVLVHHTGKDATKGMRGHSSLHAALDAAIEVERDVKGTRTWSVAKAKDGEDGKRVTFKLVRHVLGTDSDGDEISSCYVAPDSSAIFARPEPSGSNQKAVLKAIKAALAGVQASTGVAGCPVGVACLKMDDAVAAGAACMTTTAKNKRSNVAKSTVTKLVDGGFLGSGLDDAGEAWCWLA